MDALPSRRHILTLTAASAGAALATRGQRTKLSTNVVIFMTDDHGAWATGAYGAKDIRTPNIDELARSGVRFSNAFAATPVCSPSRLTYLTGCLPSTHGVQDWIMPEESFGVKSKDWTGSLPTWSKALQNHGYRLGMCGKWHMGNDDRAQQGFTFWATVPGGGGTYNNPTFVKNGETVPVRGFKTDAVGDFAIEFLNGHKEKNQPFCLLVPFYAPHTPYDPTPEGYSSPYAASTFPDFPDTTPRADQNPQLKRMFGGPKPKAGYSSLITAADANIGRILKRLDELALRENTLVIVTADQGWNAGQHGVWGKGNGTRPFNMLEESIRVPMIWNHPARIPQMRTVTEIVSSYDFFPSLLDYLGVPARMKRPVQPGNSYAPFVTGGVRPPRWRDRAYFEYAYVRAVRTRNLKLIERAEGYPSELYDLEADPNEARNLWDDPQYAGQRAALSKDLHRFFARTGAPELADWRRSVKTTLPSYP